MAKQVVTLVSFVLDETGSMESVRDATISGFNEYVESLKKQPGKKLLTLTLFNSSRIQTVYSAKLIGEVPALNRDTYNPDATTPLYDAIAHTISEIEREVAKMKSKPSVLCVIMTDGLENASKEYDQQKIFQRIQAKEKEGWTFAYLGANQDAWAVSASIGVPKGNTLNYAADQPKQALGRASLATLDYMRSGSRQSRNLFADD